MNVKLPYRHELKYEITPVEYLALRQRLRSLLHPDPHVGSDGRYQIYSLYFDNCQDKALTEKRNGVSRREKFRLRYYNGDMNRIALEKKQKINGLCLKTSCLISQEACRQLLAGDAHWLPEPATPLLQELDFKRKSQLLRPRTLVTYLREPYLYSAGNVRITFDMDIRTSLDPIDFLQPDSSLIPILAPGHMILEIKYDAFLPEAVARLLQVGVARARACSKYAECRKYE